MKEIKAYVHSNRIAAVIAAVEDSGLMTRGGSPGVRNVNVTSIHSLLKPMVDAEQRYSVELGEAVIDEVRFELVCEDSQVDALVTLIERTARTGQRVAGWIVVTDLDRVTAIQGAHV